VFISRRREQLPWPSWHSTWNEENKRIDVRNGKRRIKYSNRVTLVNTNLLGRSLLGGGLLLGSSLGLGGSSLFGGGLGLLGGSLGSGFLSGGGSLFRSSLLGGGSLLRSGLLGHSLGGGLLASGSLLLGGRLLDSGLLLGGSLGLGSGGSLFGDSLFELGRELVRVLDLDKVSSGNTVLQGVEESGIEPLLVLGQMFLHVLLHSNHGGTSSVLELRDGSDNTFLVRHDFRCLLTVKSDRNIVRYTGSSIDTL
jgi:hypothetical protein